MAFATSQINAQSAGSLSVLTGSWTGSFGDTVGTVNVGGANVYLAHFYDQSATTPTMVPMPVTVTTSAGISTVSVTYVKDVTAGKFIIFYN